MGAEGSYSLKSSYTDKRQWLNYWEITGTELKSASAIFWLNGHVLGHYSIWDILVAGEKTRESLWNIEIKGSDNECV